MIAYELNDLINITFNIPYNNAERINRYNIYLLNEDKIFTYIGNSQSNTYTINKSNLPEYSEYIFGVKAVNSEGYSLLSVSNAIKEFDCSPRPLINYTLNEDIIYIWWENDNPNITSFMVIINDTIYYTCNTYYEIKIPNIECNISVQMVISYYCIGSIIIRINNEIINNLSIIFFIVEPNIELIKKSIDDNILYIDWICENATECNIKLNDNNYLNVISPMEFDNLNECNNTLIISASNYYGVRELQINFDLLPSINNIRIENITKYLDNFNLTFNIYSCPDSNYSLEFYVYLLYIVV